MKYHRRSKLETARSHIAQALSHLNEKVDLLEQTFFLTIHVENKNQIRKIMKPIFYAICDVLKTKESSISGSRQPGLILAGDIENSQKSISFETLKKPYYPHIHGLLCIPKDVMARFTHADIEKYIEDAIGEIIEVKQKTNSVRCEKYIPKKPIVEVATYLNKAAYFADQWHIHEYQAIVLPRDFTIGRIYGTKKQDMAAQQDFIYDMLTINPDLTKIDLRKNVSTETPELHPMDDQDIRELAKKIRRSEVAAQF